MKLQLKWSRLNGEQRKVIKDAYDKRKSEYPEEHHANPNSLSYFINPTNGKVMFQKDF